MGKGIQAIALGKQVQAGVSQYESLLHLRLGGVRKDKLCIPKTRLRRRVPNDELRVRLDRRLQRRKDIVFRRVPQFVQNLGNTGLSGRAADTHTRAAL